jgi:hypothetical protein
MISEGPLCLGYETLNISRLYNVYVVLADPQAEPIWHWERWLEVVEIIDPIVRLARGKPLVESGQMTEKKKWVKFGRIGWSRDGHAKWAHHSPATGDDSNNWTFFWTSVEVPSFRVCYEEKQPSDVMFYVRPEHAIDGPLTFSPVVILAIAQDLQAEELAENAVRKIAKLVSSKQVRPYATPLPRGGYQDSLSDQLRILGVFKGGNRQAVGPVLEVMRDEYGSWTELTPF